MGLDLEPDAEAVLRLPDPGHLGTAVAGDHAGGHQVVRLGALADPMARTLSTEGRAVTPRGAAAPGGRDWRAGSAQTLRGKAAPPAARSRARRLRTQAEERQELNQAASTARTRILRLRPPRNRPVMRSIHALAP